MRLRNSKSQTADFSAELGRAAGAVLNATVKSGTNSIHGAVWEFFRNDKLDAADWFEDNAGIGKGELRQNQFGASIGGPIIKNKIFYFGDYEGLRRVQGNTQSGFTVPTLAERNSGYTNLADIITGQGTTFQGRRAGTADTAGHNSGSGYHPRGRSGRAWILFPGIVTLQHSTVYVRDPFGTCAASTTQLHSRRLRAESTSCRPVGSERHQALESLPAADHWRSFSSNFASSPSSL